MIVSLVLPQRRADHIETRDVSYRTTPLFNALGAGIIVILVALYAVFW